MRNLHHRPRSVPATGAGTGFWLLRLRHSHKIRKTIIAGLCYASPVITPVHSTLRDLGAARTCFCFDSNDQLTAHAPPFASSALFSVDACCATCLPLGGLVAR